MHGIVLTIHVILSAILILIVLIQSGRSGGIAGMFGGGGADALFSTSSQQSGLRNATVIVAGLFFMTSIALTMLSSRQRVDSVFNRALPMPQPVQPPAPAGGMPTTPGAGMPQTAAPAAPAAESARD